MGQVRLSNQFMKGVEVFNSMTDEQFNGIIHYISEMPVAASIMDAEKYFKSHLGMESVDVVFPTIIGIVDFVQKNKDKDALNDIIGTLESKKEFDLEKLKSRFIKILDNSKNILLSKKAADLFVENNNNFNECKIITDIRLIFDENITLSKRNAVIVHKLHFEVSNPTNSEDIFIYLDMQDLLKLKEVVDRAILKEELIKEDYENINFISLNE